VSEQAVSGGEPIGRQIVRTDKQDVVWDRISCVRCGAECERLDDRILQLREQVEQLEFQVAFLTCRLVSTNRLPRKYSPAEPWALGCEPLKAAIRGRSRGPVFLGPH